MEIFVLVLLGVILLFTVIYRLKNDRKTALINRIPGPKSYPILGTTLPYMLMTKPERFTYLRSLVQKFGPLYRTWLGRVPVVNLADPNYVELILNNTTHNEKGIVYNFVLPWLGNGLITSKGTKWHQHRKLITPTFHFQILETFMDVFVGKSKLLIKLLEGKADGMTAFDIFPYITHCTLDIIAETAMGIQVNAMLEEDNTYAKAVSGACDEFANRAAKGWLSYDFIYYKTSYGEKYRKCLSILHNTTDRVIRERKNLRQKSDSGRESVTEDEFGRKKRRAFLDLLMDLSQNENALTEEEIRDEVNTFMFAGHDTTTSSISWTLFLLGLHQDIQEKVFQEINEIFNEDTPLKFNDLHELKYLERVIKESLRLYPSVPAIGRITSEDMKIEEYTIPKGTSVTMHIIDIHMNPKYFSQPDKFDPDRFLPENSKNRHPYAYIPFSAGPRNCIGQRFALLEEKVILSCILKHYKITSTQTIHTVEPIVQIVLRPNKGLFVILEKRETSK